MVDDHCSTAGTLRRGLEGARAPQRAYDSEGDTGNRESSPPVMLSQSGPRAGVSSILKLRNGQQRRSWLTKSATAVRWSGAKWNAYPSAKVTISSASSLQESGGGRGVTRPLISRNGGDVAGEKHHLVGPDGVRVR